LDYEKLKAELLEMRKELHRRLEQYNHAEFAAEYAFTLDRNWLIQLIQADLQDVEHALRKMDTGEYGCCEKTGQSFTENQIYALPTARTVDDFDIQGYYAKIGYF
jgi:DnaK suppressor protein